MPRPLSQQVVVITGASSGAGLATAQAAAARGARVVMAARNASDLEAVEALAARAVEAYGRIDTWVNNAGVSAYATFREQSVEDFWQVMRINVLGQIHGAKAALPHLERSEGALICTGSVLSDLSVPTQAAYCASKHAVKGWVEALRIELAQAGSPVRVTLIRPASMNTPLFEKAKTQLGAVPQPLGPTYQPEVYAEVVLRAAEGDERGEARGERSRCSWDWPRWRSRARRSRSPSRTDEPGRAARRPDEPRLPRDLLFSRPPPMYARPSLARLRPQPDAFAVSRNFLSLTTGRDGFIHDGSENGLFVHETRMLSRYRWTVEREPMTPVALSAVDEHTWLGYYARQAPGSEQGGGDQGSGMMDPRSEYTLELRLRRTLAAGVREEVCLTNYTQQPTRFRLALEADADFADLQETSGERKQHGRCERAWDEESRTLTFDYRAEHAYRHQDVAGKASIHRCLRLRIADSDVAPRYEALARGGRIAFDVELPPRGRWSATVEWVPEVEPLALLGGGTGTPFAESFDAWDARDRDFLGDAATFETAESATLAPVVTAALDGARRDLAALRLYDLDDGRGGWTMAAGLPIYLALFGRDTLTAAWQAAPLGPEMMAGTLDVLARFQGTEDVAWRDEQPGRMLHEMHTGPTEVLGFNPTARYYGSVTTSALYPLIAAEHWHWTGDRDAAFRSLKPALDALAWLDEHGDRDGDGFYEYKTRSEQGTKHQAWKDSPDAIVDADGCQVEPPIATCEEQSFVYQAKAAFAEVLWSLGNRDEARRLFAEAKDLKERFNEAFWMEDEGFYAMGLDADKNPIRAIGSNPGHCLATAIVPKERAERVAERLFQPDLFSGWGIRTLSTENPAYNPYSYHRGSVWPVEHGTFALALMRYGLWDHLHRLTRAQFEAAALFEHVRLPEVFAGHARNEEQPFPAFYPQANSPQAWSASAVFCFVQAMLGLYPYAPLKLLVLDPHLPEWLPELTVRNLRVGQAKATIRFYRKEDGTSDYHVEDVKGTLHVIRQPSPWSLTATTGERLVDALTSLLPGK